MKMIKRVLISVACSIAISCILGKLNGGLNWPWLFVLTPMAIVCSEQILYGVGSFLKWHQRKRISRFMKKNRFPE